MLLSRNMVVWGMYIQRNIFTAIGSLVPHFYPMASLKCIVADMGPGGQAGNWKQMPVTTGRC